MNPKKLMKTYPLKNFLKEITGVNEISPEAIDLLNSFLMNRLEVIVEIFNELYKGVKRMTKEHIETCLSIYLIVKRGNSKLFKNSLKPQKEFMNSFDDSDENIIIPGQETFLDDEEEPEEDDFLSGYIN